MDFTADNGERLLKSWDYAKTKGMIFTKGEYNLTVTDKRVISTARTKLGDARTDIKLSTIEGVSTTYKTGSLVAAIITLILGIVLSVVFAIVFLPMIAVGLLLVLIGILCIMFAGTSVSVVLYVKSHSESFLAANSITRSKRAKKVRVKVDRVAAAEIANQLATYILCR